MDELISPLGPRFEGEFVDSIIGNMMGGMQPHQEPPQLPMGPPGPFPSRQSPAGSGPLASAPTSRAPVAPSPIQVPSALAKRGQAPLSAAEPAGRVSKAPRRDSAMSDKIYTTLKINFDLVKHLKTKEMNSAAYSESMQRLQANLGFLNTLAAGQSPPPPAPSVLTPPPDAPGLNDLYSRLRTLVTAEGPGNQGRLPPAQVSGPPPGMLARAPGPEKMKGAGLGPGPGNGTGTASSSNASQTTAGSVGNSQPPSVDQAQLHQRQQLRQQLSQTQQMPIRTLPAGLAGQISGPPQYQKQMPPNQAQSQAQTPAQFQQHPQQGPHRLSPQSQQRQQASFVAQAQKAVPAGSQNRRAQAQTGQSLPGALAAPQQGQPMPTQNVLPQIPTGSAHGAVKAQSGPKKGQAQAIKAQTGATPKTQSQSKSPGPNHNQNQNLSQDLKQNLKQNPNRDQVFGLDQGHNQGSVQIPITQRASTPLDLQAGASRHDSTKPESDELLDITKDKSLFGEGSELESGKLSPGQEKFDPSMPDPMGGHLFQLDPHLDSKALGGEMFNFDFAHDDTIPAWMSG